MAAEDAVLKLVNFVFNFLLHTTFLYIALRFWDCCAGL